MFSYSSVRGLICVMGLAACASVPSAWAQSGMTGAVSAAMVTLHPAVTLRGGDKAVGPLDVARPMHVVVALKLRNEQQLDRYIARPGFRPLTSGQFQLLYGPSREDAQTVADYLTKAGFANVKIDAGNALVEADGRADTSQAAFRTSFVHVKTHDGRDAYANSSAVQIPAELQSTVHAVLGMQNVNVFKTFERPYDPMAARAMSPQALPAGYENGHSPYDFRTIYDANNMANVTSVPVGSISSGPMAHVLKDLAGLYPGVSVTLKGDTTVGNGSGTNSNDVEFDLDSQVIIDFTGATRYYFYVASSNTDADFEVAFSQVVADNFLRAIDFSFSKCEADAQADGTATSMDTTFKQAVAQGQTFFVSAGDLGADSCGNGTNSPPWPASSQYATSVGGTELFVDPDTTWQYELVWNNNNGHATGGGPSSFEPLPSWQLNVPGITNQTYRGVPDIAFDGDPASGAMITVDGQINQQYGGTSLSAPLATGMWAHILQTDGVGLGFASPVIYKVAQISKVAYDSAFHDVTYGNNNGFNAFFGWDYTSGWGSVDVNQFAKLATFNSAGPISPLVSFGTLPALQVTTPIPGSAHTPGDFNGDGVSDLLWFNPTLSQVGYWAMAATANTSSTNGGVSRTGIISYNVTPGYFVGAVGDFNNDGYADLIFTNAKHDLYLWTNNQHGGWTSSYMGTYPGQWQLIGAGDINGDGYDDLLWLNPSACEFGYWIMQGAKRVSTKAIGIPCGYYPISIGYYTPSNRLSILWTSAANDLYVWDSMGGSPGNLGNGFNSYNLTNDIPPFAELVSIGGGYQGQNIGAQIYLSLGSVGSSEGISLSRSFDDQGNQTNAQFTYNFEGFSNLYIGSAGYVIAGNGVNNTGVYNFDPVYMYISTGGLQNNSNLSFTGNAPQFPALADNYQYGDYWSYPSGWWVVGALFNNAAAPPWQ